MSRECPKCDTEINEGDEVYDVRMRDKDSPSPDLEFYTITVCSSRCVQKISQSGRVYRVSSEKTEYE